MNPPIDWNGMKALQAGTLELKLVIASRVCQ